MGSKVLVEENKKNICSSAKPLQVVPESLLSDLPSKALLTKAGRERLTHLNTVKHGVDGLFAH